MKFIILRVLKYIISNCVFSDQFFHFEWICVRFDRSVSSDM